MSSMVSNITGRLRRPLALSVIAVMLMVAVAVPFVIDNAVAAETTSYKYKVYLSGSTYYVKNAAGATVYSSTNAAASIQKALSSLTSGRTVKETVQLQGSFVLTKALSVPSYTVLNLDGTITMGAGSNTNMIYSSGVSYVDIVGGEWNGNQAAPDARLQCQGWPGVLEVPPRRSRTSRCMTPHTMASTAWPVTT